MYQPQKQEQSVLEPGMRFGLYDSRNEHDACGVGFIMRLDNKPTHTVVEKALLALVNLSHRGASGADADSGDGAGILIRIPDEFLRDTVNFELPPPGEYALGMTFLPVDSAAASACRREMEALIVSEGWTLLGWRKTPILSEHLGKAALAVMALAVADCGGAPLKVGDGGSAGTGAWIRPRRGTAVCA